MKKHVIDRNPGILKGTPVFKGSRIPIRILFDYLESGDSLEVFLDEYPGISKDQAIEVLELAKQGLLNNSEAAA